MSSASLLRNHARRRSLSSALFVFTLLTSMTASVGSVVRLSDEQLTRLSSIIAEGRVTSVRGEWNPDHTQIHTIVTLQVSNTLKGAVPVNGLLVFRLLGGQVGDIAFRVSDAPVFRVGEDVIVFVSNEGLELFPIAGMYQGKLTVVTDSITGRPTIQERKVERDVFVRDITRIVTEERGR